MLWLCLIVFFFFNDTATTEIYTLSLHDALPIPQPRQLLREKGFDADVLQPDRVQHAGRRLADSGRSVARVRAEREPFRAEGAQVREIDEVGELQPVSERSRRRDDRIRELERAEPNFQPRVRQTFSHALFSGARIGPSRQEITNAFSVAGITQPRQAPKPQPIAASVENSEERPKRSTTRARAANIGIGPQAKTRA